MDAAASSFFLPKEKDLLTFESAAGTGASVALGPSVFLLRLPKEKERLTAESDMASGRLGLWLRQRVDCGSSSSLLSLLA